MAMELGMGEVGNRADEYVLRMDQYNHYTFPIQLTAGENSSAINANGGSIVWTIRRRPEDQQPLKTLTIEWVDQATGLATGSLYCDLPCGPKETDIASQYFHELVFIDSLAKARTCNKGPCVINRGTIRT